MATVMTYSPKDISLTIQGYTIPAMASVELAWDQPQFKIVRGIRQQMTRVRNRNTSAVLTVTLLQTSIGNTVLQKIVEGDAKFGSGRLTVALTDVAGNLGFTSDQAFVTGYANVTFSSGFNERVWTFGLFQVAIGDGQDSSKTTRSLLEQGSALAEAAIGKDTDALDVGVDALSGLF